MWTCKKGEGSPDFVYSLSIGHIWQNVHHLFNFSKVCILLVDGVFSYLHGIPPVDLYLISEKKVRLTGFSVYFELNFYCLCSLQNQLWNWFLQAKNPVHRTWVFPLDFQNLSADQQGDNIIWPHTRGAFYSSIHFMNIGNQDNYTSSNWDENLVIFYL